MTVLGQQRSLEDFVDFAINVLKANLPTALAAQVTKYADADAAAGRVVDLVAPRDEDFYAGGTGTLIRYPAVEVSIPDLRVTRFALGMVDADTDFTLVVMASNSDPRQEILYRQMNRYGAAVSDVLTQPGALGSAIVDQFRGAWRFNPEQNVADEVQSGVALIYGMKDAWLRP